MSILMEREITIDRIMLANYDVFKALDDPIRGKIVQLLHKKQLNVEQITPVSYTHLTLPTNREV